MIAVHLSIVSSLLLGFAGALSQAGETVEARLDERDLAFLCSLPGDLKPYSHISSIPKDSRAFGAAADRVRSIAWRPLPAEISCDGKPRKLRGDTDFLNKIRLTPDGSVAAVAGGYVKGPTYGQGGECVFVLNGDAWSFLGCVGTWVS